MNEILSIRTTNDPTTSNRHLSINFLTGNNLMNCALSLGPDEGTVELSKRLRFMADYIEQNDKNIDKQAPAHTTFVVTAYRAGQRDNHSYVVAAHTQQMIAQAIADLEFDSRGGKYACEVIEISAGVANITRKQVYYKPADHEGEWGTGEESAKGWEEA